jgi:hypothetical protein
MKIYNLNDFVNGWVVGNFEPSIFKENFEVGIARHCRGDHHQDHFHKKSTEINIVLEGRIKINDQIFAANDIFVLYPYEISQVQYLTDVALVVIRNKSDPNDKFLVDIVNNTGTSRC